MILRIFNYLMVAFMLAPLVLIIWMSFTPEPFFRLPISEFSLRWYYAVFQHSGFIDAFWLSVRLGLVSGVLAASLAFLASYGIVRYQFPGKRALDGLFMSPLIIPAIVFGIAMLQFINRAGFYNTFFALVVTHTMVVIPFAIRAIHAQLTAIPIELEWAAMNLGATRLRTLWRVTLPLCLKGVLAGFLLAFIISFSEVTATIFMTGPAYQTLPIRIYNYLTDQIDPTVAAISAMLIVMSLSLVAVLDRLGGLRNVKS